MTTVLTAQVYIVFPLSFQLLYLVVLLCTVDILSKEQS